MITIVYTVKDGNTRVRNCADAHDARNKLMEAMGSRIIVLIGHVHDTFDIARDLSHDGWTVTRTMHARICEREV